MFWKETSRFFKELRDNIKRQLERARVYLKGLLSKVKIDAKTRKRVLIWTTYFAAATLISALFWFRFLGVSTLAFPWEQEKPGQSAPDGKEQVDSRVDEQSSLDGSPVLDDLVKPDGNQPQDVLKDETAPRGPAEQENDPPVEPDTPAGTEQQDVPPPEEQNNPEELVEDEPQNEQAVPTFRLEDMVLPIRGAVITGFGHQKSQTLDEWRFHPGIDIIGIDDDAVRAVLPGTVSEICQDREYGLLVILDHGSGRVTRYGSLSVVHVALGQHVAQGKTIGLVGDTAPYELSQGVHLHFELRISGAPVDPLQYLDFENSSNNLLT